MRYKSQMLAVVATGLLLWSTGADGQTLRAAQTGKQGKPQAPVEIAGSVQSSSASLVITFKAAAEQVDVRVYGTDGLVVSGTETPVTGRSVKAGETLTLAVAYTAGQGKSNLAVNVSGEFHGNRRTRIASFTVGDKRVAALPGSATVVDEKGRRIKVLPAKDK